LPALNALFDESKLPIVSGIQTLPLVYIGEDGSVSICKTNGIDRASGVMFRIDSEVAAALPDPEKITFKDAKDAHNRLASGWLGEVAASPKSKAVLISIPLTVIQRHHFRDARPAYLTTSPVAGAGKTTTMHMISEVLFGRPAAAAAWSPSTTSGTLGRRAPTARSPTCRTSLNPSDCGRALSRTLAFAI
jgi:hypothetical protein